jgi:hypothetical protein
LKTAIRNTLGSFISSPASLPLITTDEEFYHKTDRAVKEVVCPENMGWVPEYEPGIGKNDT